MKRLSVPLLTFLMIFIPVWGMTQDFLPRPVAIMPFTGEPDERVNVEFRDMVSGEVENVKGNFLPEVQTLPRGVVADDLAPDEPPPDYTFGGQQYVLTGAAYPEIGEHHVQVWLWDVTVPTLVYTDELVCEEVEDAGEYMPLLIEWIFSHVPDREIGDGDGDGDDDDDGYDYGSGFGWNEPAEVAVAPPPDPGRTEQVEPPKGQRSAQPIFEDEDKWFHVGFRIGVAGRIYRADNNWFNTTATVFNTDWSQIGLSALSFEAALLGIWQALPFLAFQLEFPVVTIDRARFRTVDATLEPGYANFGYWSLNPTILGKVTIKAIPNWWGILLGGYYVWPIASLASNSVPTNPTPFGWILGAEFGFKLSSLIKDFPGMTYLDLRFAHDVDNMNYSTNENGSMPFFKRSSIVLSMRFQWGLVNRDIKPITTNRR